jgi:uncharacterized protein
MSRPARIGGDRAPLGAAISDPALIAGALEFISLLGRLDRDGFAVTPPLIEPDACAGVADLYEDAEVAFRSTIEMARHGYGQGQYKYFAYPLPPPIAFLRHAVYAHLAPIANAWAQRLGGEPVWPDRHELLIERCAAAGQPRPTPLLLRYAPGDYNRLHQDLYGEIHFPLQAILLLDRPGADFDGGELVLVEQQPRRQSRPMVIPLVQGALAVIPVKERPILGPRGVSRVQMRHGVSALRQGVRRTLGLIFHDAA